MPRWNAPKLMQVAAIAILIAATGAALAWLAQAPGSEPEPDGAQPPAPPSMPPPVDTSTRRAALDEPPAPAATSDGEDAATAAFAFADDAEPQDPAPATRTTPWRAIDPGAFSLTPATVSLYAHLPGAYEWPLLAIDGLEVICLQGRGEASHLGIMRTADGRLFHWAEERLFLQEYLDADGSDSGEIRSVAHPGAFMEPIRAAVHAACERSLREANTADGPR